MTELSHTLTEYIRDEIAKQQGCISFASYMELALYHPELGYYCSDHFNLGARGDFTTAPEISPPGAPPLFAHCLAKTIEHMMSTLGNTDVLELGAGTGRLAHDLFTVFEKQSCLPERYFIYEISPQLRKQQQTFLRNTCPAYFSRIHWLDVLPLGFNGTILANEVLDALPVHCFHIENHSVYERGVGWENNQFVWQRYPTPSQAFLQYVTALRERYALESGYESEINLNLPAFITALANTLEQGLLLLIDYGYGQREYYHPERKHGTLTCFYQHHHHPNPLLHPGSQDITAHVDFTHVIQTAVDAGFALRGYTSQSSFLLSCGLTDLVVEAEKHLSPAQAVNLHYAVKLLTLPTEMGERTKVMALSKGMEQSALPGFTGHDRRRDL